MGWPVFPVGRWGVCVYTPIGIQRWRGLFFRYPSHTAIAAPYPRTRAGEGLPRLASGRLIGLGAAAIPCPHTSAYKLFVYIYYT